MLSKYSKYVLIVLKRVLRFPYFKCAMSDILNVYCVF